MGWLGSAQHCFSGAQQGQTRCPGGHMCRRCRGSGIHLPRRQRCFPSRAGAAPGGWGQPRPRPICSLFVFLHLSITSQINTPQRGGQGALPCQRSQDPAPGYPAPQPYGCPSTGHPGPGDACWVGAQAMSPPCHTFHAAPIHPLPYIHTQPTVLPTPCPGQWDCSPWSSGQFVWWDVLGEPGYQTQPRPGTHSRGLRCHSLVLPG